MIKQTTVEDVINGYNALQSELGGNFRLDENGRSYDITKGQEEPTDEIETEIDEDWDDEIETIINTEEYAKAQEEYEMRQAAKKIADNYRYIINELWS